MPIAQGQLPLPSLPVTENGTPVPLADAQVPAIWQPQTETTALESTAVENGIVQTPASWQPQTETNVPESTVTENDNDNATVNDSSAVEIKEAKQENE